MADIVIVGGGIIGMLSARELARAGADVTIIEKGETGQESSWAGGGILSPLYPWRFTSPVNDLAVWSQQRYQKLARELFEETGIDPEWVCSGLLVLNAADREQAVAWGDARRVDLRTCDREEVRMIEPALATADVETAVWMPDIAQIRNPRLAQAVKQSLLANGVAIREGAEVKKVCVEGGRVSGVDTGAETINTGAVLVAGGAWSGELVAPLGAPLPVQPVKGQMILYKTDPGVVSRIVLSHDRYLIPRCDGHVLVGSTVEQAGFEKSTTEEARRELQTVAEALVPALAGYPVVNHWSGLRPGSPQGIPYIGEHPLIKGLFINAGHFRNGVVMAPAAARLLSDIVLGRAPILDTRWFSVP